MSHEWNNDMVHEWFADTEAQDGRDAALSQLRAHVRSHLIEKGLIRDKQFDWSYTLRGDHLYHEQSHQNLEDITNGTVTRSYRDLARQGDVDATPMVLATIREAQRLASEGHNRILMPEQHILSDGQVVVRYYTVLERDVKDPSTFHASRLDVGIDTPVVEAKADMKRFATNEPNALFREHGKEKHAYVVALDATSTQKLEEIRTPKQENIHFKRQDEELRKPQIISSEPPTLSLDKHRGRRVSIEEPFRPKARGSIQQVTETMAHVSHRIARDTGETIIGVSRFLQRKGIRQNTRDRVLGLPVVPDVRIVFEKNTSGLSKPDGQSARLTLKRIRSRAVRIDESIVKRHREMRRDVVALGIIAEKGVAVHAIPMFLASLAEKLPAPVRAMEKSIKRHKKKEIRLKNHEVRKRKQDTRSDVKEGQSFKIEHKGRKKRRKTHKEVLTSDNKHIPKERKALRKRKRKIGVGEKTGKKSAVVDRLTVFTFKKEKQLNKNRMRRKAGKVEQVMEFKRLSKREKKLWRLVTGFARRMEHQRKEMNRTPYRITKSESVKRTKTREVARRETVFRKTRKESKEAINNFFFALFFWVLLKHFEKQMQTHVTEKPQETRKEENLPVSQEIGQNQRQENLIVKEPAPWILLSVIWYLVMAREGGLVKMPNANPPAGGPMPNKKSGKKKRFKKKQFFQTSSIPKHAVIFAFNS